jgi:hypothetical protein
VLYSALPPGLAPIYAGLSPERAGNSPAGHLKAAAEVFVPAFPFMEIRGQTEG